MENDTMKFNEFTSRDKFVLAVVQALNNYTKESISQHGKANILLSGGSTPGPIYSAFDRQLDQIDNINLGLVDERFVPLTSEFSNERLLRNCFLSRKKYENSICGMVHDSFDREKNILILKEKYAHFIKRTDIVVLGMGQDGHTASIFPNDHDSIKALISEEAFMNTKAPTHPDLRITANFSLLLNAKYILLLITGEEKLNVLMDSSKMLPIHKLLEKRNDVQIFYAK